MNILQTMENPRHYGPITALCIDKKRAWIIVGTSTGVLTLWDKRFGLLIKSWRAGVGSTGKSVRINQIAIHPSKGRNKDIIVALEASKKTTDRSSTTLLEVWDIEKSTLVESFTTRTGSPADPIPDTLDVIGADAETTPAAAIAALVKSRQHPSDLTDSSRYPSREELQTQPLPDVRSMVVGSDFGGYSTFHRSDFGDIEASSSRSGARGFMVTGSEDSKLRLWDLGKIEKTAVLSGADTDHEKPSYRYLCPFFSEVNYVLKSSKYVV